ncbi:hypothetical protein FQN57_000832 [Myotisia sp. PD_48]|nr:hypothetical protein FQN57_000832 [Myotisia sp. PD_48]
MTYHAALWAFAVLSCLLAILSPTAAYITASDTTLKELPRPGTDFDIHNGALLAPILRTRVPGTPGSTAVLEHFVTFFKTSLPDWKIEFQNSTSKTPATGNKDIPFVNLIASRDPPGTHPGDVARLTLVAHYDSKITPEGFIGAIDSAAPCAMILHSVRSIDAALTKKWKAMEDNHESLLDDPQGIQVLLLDGEEAFHAWSDTDSLYGARSLAESMEHEYHPSLSTFKTKLSAIKLFVLLDLLGSKDPNIPSYFKTTHWAYKHMAKLEQRLRELGQFKSASSKREQGKAWLSEASKTDDQDFNAQIGDDHLPFMERGVDILHLIPIPFPKVWHTIDDDAEHLDPATVEDWSTLLTAFLTEWMELEGFLGSKRSEALDKDKSEL